MIFASMIVFYNCDERGLQQPDLAIKYVGQSAYLLGAWLAGTEWTIFI
jgi:hypothetical protein